MEWIGESWRKLKALAGRKQFDRDLDEEMRLHVELRAQEQIKSGTAPDDARAAARRRFGNPTLLKETSRDVWGWSSIESFWQDLRYAARMLSTSPAFTLVAVLSLAIGIGANTAIFSIANAILLKSLPVRDPDQLRLVLWTGHSRIPRHSGSGYSTHLHGIEVNSSFSYPMYKLLAASVPQFSSLMGFQHAQVTVVAAGESHYAGAFFATGNFFSDLGLSPLAGRLLSPEDDRPGAPAVVVLSYRYWERRFGLDPSVVGRTITINGRPVTVAGITPRPFIGIEPGRDYDLFLPMARVESFGPEWYSLGKEDHWWVQILGRLRPGISDREARAALDVVLTRASAAYAETQDQKLRPFRAVVEPGTGGVPLLREQASAPLLILGSVVALVLLIACANIANLLLARGTARRREIAVRLSIGAGRWRLIRQLLTESLLTAGLGAALGLAFASPLAKAALAMAASSEELVIEANVDPRTLLFTVAVTLLTALIFGLAPAFRSTRVDLTPALKDGAAGASGAGRPLRLSRFLVAGQVALSTLLLAGAGLFVRTLQNLSTVDPGFNSQQLLIFSVDGSRSGYQGEKLTGLYQRIRTKVEAIPGVRAVSLSSVPLIGNSMSNSDITVPGYTPKSGQSAMTYQMVIGSRFLNTMGIPILLGRDIEDRDSPSVPHVAVVNETFVRSYMAGQNPLGRVFYFGTRSGSENPDPKDVIEVVGVAKDAKYDTLRHEIPPTAYTPYLQRPDWVRQMTFEVRTALPPMAIATAVRNIVGSIDRNVPVADLRTQEEQIRLSLGMERLFATLVGSFGVIAAMLASIGLYGVLAYTVTRRTGEIGIRMALGAGRRDVLAMVLRDSLIMVAAGVAVGVPAALALTRFLQAMLYGIAPNDPASFIGAGLMMSVVAMLAAWIPARRAARVDPMQALRCE
ncbi:MAG: ABC transporter permease [Acidobacteriia bacterium]|nr:ABC transporter permease [Terriglobia bacterium]